MLCSNSLLSSWIIDLNFGGSIRRIWLCIHRAFVQKEVTQVWPHQENTREHEKLPELEYMHWLSTWQSLKLNIFSQGHLSSLPANLLTTKCYIYHTKYMQRRKWLNKFTMLFVWWEIWENLYKILFTVTKVWLEAQEAKLKNLPMATFCLPQPNVLKHSVT